ncbi:MAG: ribonuclease J [Deltaproteobacteria bacterium]|jgi:ribonuclease J|nr:ribonuclease J [Deltaproteobacteria bacterium]
MAEQTDEQNDSRSLDIIPLGGLEEIGLNCTALVYGQAIIVIDSGLMFPGAKLPGVDLVVPDFSYLKNNADHVLGLILTHGHEDHIGALAHFLKNVSTTVYGTKLTLALTMGRLDEYQVPFPETVQIKARQVIELGPFKIEFIAVNHSILGSLALAITTPIGLFIHTGDFKIDSSAPPDERTDLYSFSRYGEQNVLALLSDSTNSDVPGYTVSETEVGRSLTYLFQKARGRIILACFASSLTRIRQVALAANLSGRKIVFDGRSMINSVALGRDFGYLNLDDDHIADIDESLWMDDETQVIVVTGSQGEPLSALARMAHGEHKHIFVQPGDTIIFSARVIPGNELAIADLTNLFHSLGAEVIDNRYHTVHSSGHGQIEELKLMLSLVKPKYFIPIHGEPQHLASHAALAVETGLKSSDVKILKNGHRLMFFADQTCRLGTPVTTGRMLVDGNRLGQADDPVIRRRLSLAELGMVYVILVLNQGSLSLAAPPRINIHALHYEGEPDLALEAAEISKKTLISWRIAQDDLDNPNIESLYESLKRDVRSLFKHSIRRRPLIYTEVIILGSDSHDELSEN